MQPGLVNHKGIRVGLYIEYRLWIYDIAIMDTNASWKVMIYDFYTSITGHNIFSFETFFAP